MATDGIFLDANENALGSVSDERANRYPDPYQREVKDALAKQKKVNPEQIFLGNGSDEAIDLLFRAFCIPGKDKVLTFPPTYGMYSVCAQLNDVEVLEVALSTSFQLNLKKVEQVLNPSIKMILICSPNNPSGNSIEKEKVIWLLNNFSGIVIIDEAYQDFSSDPSWVSAIDNYPNLVVLQTFSKAWGMAGLRLGVAMGNPEIISVLNRIKYPYNINQNTQQQALVALQNVEKKEQMVHTLLKERSSLVEALNSVSIVENVYPSDANFILIRIKNAQKIYEALLRKGIVVRNRSNLVGCTECVRITVGTTQENSILINALMEMG